MGELMFTVGLTGGLGSGKSTVSALFEELGARIIDTDLIARALVEPGQPALRQISAHFGQDVLHTDGSLNRPHLRGHIFGHPKERAWLENLLHPLIQKEVMAQLSQGQGPYTIVVIPLLTENYREGYPYLDRICVVDCDEALQLERAIARDGMSPDLAREMLKAQLSREARLALANDIITNNHDLLALKSQIIALHQVYLDLAQ